MFFWQRVYVTVLCVVFAGMVFAEASPVGTTAVELRKGWFLQSSCKLKPGITGAVASSPGFENRGWIATEVPSTVLAAQIHAKQFDFDPFYGENMRKIPGTDYPIGKIYANLPMTEGSPYRCSWWYRTRFEGPAGNRRVWLRFNGINYRANIWVNGRQIADKDHIAGAYRSYEFDVTQLVRRGKPNAIAVETFAQTENDLGINFVDWNPAPADKSMGLWRNVVLSTSGAVRIRYPAVLTHFSDPSLKMAELTVVADVTNATDRPVAGTITAQLGRTQVHQIVALNANETKSVRFEPGQYAPLKIVNPRVWWPHTVGAQPLETLRVTFTAHGVMSDEQSVRFGIREVTAKLNDKGYEQFQINGRNILIRGAGWAPDMFYREPRERLVHELTYVKDLGLNAIRLEGKMGSDELFDLADQMGVLVMAGWCCCDHWEHWSKWTTADYEIAHESLISQISRLRQHPSVLVWLNGSDNPPPEPVETDYISVLKERNWQNPFISSASAAKTAVTGASGVKMSGPYDYVPPEYWYLDKAKVGGAYGFNTETSPGPAVPEKACIERVIPKQDLWPINDMWNFHAAEGKFAQYDLITAAMSAMYGPADSLADYARKSQLMNYEGERAMFEAYGRNKYTATGVIQWMLNNAWPAFVWHLYDYSLVPAGGYYGTKKANEPLHIQYSYDDRSVMVVNSLYEPFANLRATVRLIDVAGKERFRKEEVVDVASDGVKQVLTIPETAGYDGTSFVKLELRNAQENLVSGNFYWIPKTLSNLDWSKSNYFYTPAAPYSNMQDLARMPAAHLSVIHQTSHFNGGDVMRVELRNSGNAVALMVHAKAVKRGTDQEIAPVLWDDNYVSLLPGESRVLTAHFTAENAELEIDGWNVKAQ